MKRRELVMSVVSFAMILLVISSIGRIINKVSDQHHGTSPKTASSSVSSPSQKGTIKNIIPTPAPKSAAMLSVVNNRLVNTANVPVILDGAVRYSLEYLCQGDGHFQLADFQAMRAWNMNVVRIPLSSAFWSNLGNTCPDYHLSVDSAVHNAEAAGLYVDLTLQRNAPFNNSQDTTTGGAQCPMPDIGKDVQMWKDLAVIYGNDPHVLFDLYSEPYDVTWNQWANGGSITSSCHDYTYSGDAYQHDDTYQAIGMVQLAAIVRAIAPNTIIILSGNTWGYDLSGIYPNYIAHLANIMYATHPFNHATIQQPSDWDRAFGNLANTIPVIDTEFGAYDCQTNYISQEIAYFEQHHMSFIAWAWTPGNCSVPSLLADWSGTPKGSYGQYIKDQMMAVKHTP